MLCADLETSTAEERDNLANRILLKQVYTLLGAVEGLVRRRAEPPRTIIAAGEGEFLVLPLLERTASDSALSCHSRLETDISRAACADAVAVLAAEE